MFARIGLGGTINPLSGEFLLILSTVLLMTGFGLVMVLSATSATSVQDGQAPYDVALKQAMFAAIGIPLMLIISRLPMTFFKRLAWPALLVTTALQLLVFVPALGIEADGNRNWIMIGSIQAQPSEFLKLGLALWLGFVLFRKQTLLGDWRHVYIPVIPVSALVMATVIAGKDLGTAMILALIILAALFFSGVKLRIFIIPVLVAIAVIGLLAVTNSNRMARILSFSDPNCDIFGECYQVTHALWGLAGGGIFGRGLGNSQEKYDWLPAAANDFIFAIVGEELGLIGAIVVLGLFALFAIGAFRVVRRTEDPFVRITAGSISVWLVAQALINIGVVLRVFPPLGVPLPFLSQGGTSLMSVLLASGVLLAMARTLPPRGREVSQPMPERQRIGARNATISQ